jgi:phosphatidate cytidylyltransferase
LIPLGWILLLAATAEVLELVRVREPDLPATNIYLGGSLVYFAACAPILSRLLPGIAPLTTSIESLGWIALAVAVAFGLQFFAEMLRYREPGRAVLRLALATFVTLYPGLFVALLASLRFLHGNAWGMAALVSVVFVVKISDTCAYAAGKTWGRRKMSPHLSPGKTIEGGIGALVGAALSAWLYFDLMLPAAIRGAETASSWWSSMVYGVVVALAGMVGDLAESLVKRDCGRKDSSRWLPGLGGILDILDSLLFAAPTALVCWLLRLVGPASS